MTKCWLLMVGHNFNINTAAVIKADAQGAFFRLLYITVVADVFREIATALVVILRCV